MQKLDLRLIRMICYSKGQFISVTVVVAVALSIYILLNVTGVNLRNAINYYYEITKFNDIYVQLVKLPQGALEEVRTLPGIKEVQGRISVDVPLEVEDEDERVTIRLISLPEEEKINILYPIEGNAGNLGTDNVLLLEQFAEARNIQVGDMIYPMINGREYPLTVSGIVASGEFVYLMEDEQSILPAPEQFGVAYVNEEFARSVTGYRDSFNELLVLLQDQDQIDDQVDRLEEELDSYGVKRIIKREDQLSHSVLMQEVDGLEKMAQSIPLLFLVVAALIIFIMLSRIVQNDRMAIGILKALGYGNLSVLAHYTKYALLISLLGSLIGIGSGLLLTDPLSQVYAFYFNLPLIRNQIQYSYILNAFLLTAVFCVTAGFLGARPVLKILPADSLRPETPKSGKHILLEKIPFIWNKLSFSWKMVIRNIVRTKKRFAFLMLGLALSYAINTVPMYLAQIMPEIFHLQYQVFQKMDYAVEFTHPLHHRAVRELDQLIQADAIEGKLEYPFELTNGWLKETVTIIGIPGDSQVYHFFDQNQQPLILPDQGIVLTETLAQKLQVQVGDEITVKNFVPGRDDVNLEVGGIIRQYLGTNAYMELDYMGETLLDQNMITGVNILSSHDPKEKLKDVKNIAAVSSVADMKNLFLEYLDTMNLATYLYLLFGGILGFAVIYNGTTISIAERSKEFASLRVMGFDKKDIFKLLSMENLLMSVLAILLGIPLGIGMIQGVVHSFSSDMVTLPLILTPRIFIETIFATVVFVIIAQLAARNKIYRLDFIDALKSRIS
ncbi:ABC transporter permease [Dehalobacterium formicoaceticum]|uniref:ABC transporter permease n=1 Tax=Dehalobacterium formicoaceticum TaxID=51515 RepID=A0ABT1Y2P4_9FIRM|nr:ABC transporter permease [Dehalobacterium formicoaceticum]MCR6544823.1 ABC transporter permease [Dehalobacterium formicoaceticum]